MPSRNSSAGQDDPTTLGGGPQRSSADLYASVPLVDGAAGAYPPIRSITPQTPQIVSPNPAALPRPPSYLAQHGRTDSSQSDFSARDPFRASLPPTRPGTAASYAAVPGAGGPVPYDSPELTQHSSSGRYSPSEQGSVGGGGYYATGGPGHGNASTEWGSTANLNPLMYRNGPPGMLAGRSDSFLTGKEVADEAVKGGAAVGTLGYGATRDGRAALRKKGIAANDYDPLNGPPQAQRGWWGRKSTAAKWLIALAAIVAVVVAVAVPVGIVESRNAGAGKSNTAVGGGSSSGSDTGSSGGSSANDGAPKGIPSGETPSTDWHTAGYGGNGSTVFLADGSNFTYTNNFGSLFHS